MPRRATGSCRRGRDGDCRSVSANAGTSEKLSGPGNCFRASSERRPIKRARAFLFTLNPDFTAGIYVAAGDVNGDGWAEGISGAGAGGGPNVTVFGNIGPGGPTLLDNFLAYAAGFTGGVRVVAGDFNGDGIADIIAGAGPGGGPNVTVFNGPDGGLLASFLAFDPGFTGGLYVAAESQ
jgi:hypothetical protein